MTRCSDIEEIRWLELSEYERWRMTMAAIDDLTAQVTENTTVTQEVAAQVALLQEGQGTPDSVLEPLTATLTANNAALAALVPAPPAPAAPPAAAEEAPEQ